MPNSYDCDCARAVSSISYVRKAGPLYAKTPVLFFFLRHPDGRATDFALRNPLGLTLRADISLSVRPSLFRRTEAQLAEPATRITCPSSNPWSKLFFRYRSGFCIEPRFRSSQTDTLRLRVCCSGRCARPKARERIFCPASFADIRRPPNRRCRAWRRPCARPS